MRGPANGNRDDPDDLCGSGNPRKQKKCHYNGWDIKRNTNDNGNDNNVNQAVTDGTSTGRRVSTCPSANATFATPAKRNCVQFTPKALNA